MDTSNDIKKRYAKEVFTYRRDAWLVNVDAERLFDVFKIIIRKLFNNQDEIKILDIGAGNGMLTETVLSCFPNAKITMLDFSSEMLESAEMDQKIAGVIDGYIIDSIHYKEKVSFLEHLCVDKKSRKKRIATELIQEFSNKSKEKGAAYIKLYAFEKNSNAVKLYNKLGFVESTILYNKKI